MCIGSSGKPDYTSLFVDLASAPIKDGCFAWLASACSMDFRRVKRIEFDFDMKSCGSVWAAPLWMSPSPWDSPGRTSGEVDLVVSWREGSCYVLINAPLGNEPGSPIVNMFVTPYRRHPLTELHNVQHHPLLWLMSRYTTRYTGLCALASL
ncbi:Hypothetical protein SCF082_LOCUS45914 [Durusdinium trenchii]|uniref:Uncharacterized protein n=1 Tax=Durusdinium trenchii TaxID=1381693 RepID=A0ABP0RCL0_9DINO